MHIQTRVTRTLGNMRAWGRGLCAVLCFWGTISETTLHTVGPCTVNTTTVSFDCSQRKLSDIPDVIWSNITTLDLSQNNLDLTQHLSQLQGLESLVTLNLTDNYLPLLERGSLCRLPSLRTLDLSRCQLTSIQTGALKDLPRLQRIILRDNPLEDLIQASIQGPAKSLFHLHGKHLQASSDDGSTGTRRIFRPRDSKRKVEEHLSEGGNHLPIHRQFHRKLLATDLPESTTSNPITSNVNATESPSSPSHGWEYLVAVLVSAVSISILIAVLAKCHVVQRYLASYRHTRLREGDAVSQGDPGGLEVGFSMQQGHARNTHSAAVPHEEMGETEEDDDGFIEDNYIQASERERAQRAAEKLEETEEEEEEMDDIDIEFTIG